MDNLQVDKLSSPDERMTCIYTSLLLHPSFFSSLTDSSHLPPNPLALQVSDDTHLMKHWSHLALVITLLIFIFQAT